MSDDKRTTEQRNGRKGKKQEYFVRDTALRVVLYIMIILCE